MSRLTSFLLRPIAWSRHWAAYVAMAMFLTAATAAGCGGETPKPPAGSEESPLDLKVEVDEPSSGTAPGISAPQDAADSATPATTDPPSAKPSAPPAP